MSAVPSALNLVLCNKQILIFKYALNISKLDNSANFENLMILLGIPSFKLIVAYIYETLVSFESIC
jgi:hypothetical protein